MNCRTCRFWTGNRTDGDRGQCRRNPPNAGGLVNMRVNMLSQETQPAIIWGTPETGPDHWCGEWQNIPVVLQS